MVKAMIEVTPLVVTPAPAYGESLHGFLLRVVDCNGYSTIGDILRHAGMTEKELRSVRMPLEKISQLLGRSVSELQQLAYFDSESNGWRKGFNLLGHRLYTTQVHIKDAKFCPDCVREFGVISMFWDISYAVACPMHKKRPLTICPECEGKIGWNRPGIFTCSCEADLAVAPAETCVNSDLLALMDVIRRKFLRFPLESDLIQSWGFPIRNLEAMSLRTLLSTIDRFGKAVETTAMADKEEGWEYRRACVAASALGDWPNGFYQFLTTVSEVAPEKVRVEDYFGLRKQFEMFYSSIFKSNLPRDQVEFIRDEFIRFGRDKWEKAVVDKRLTTSVNESGSVITGIGEMAKEINVMPSTVKKLIQEGIIKATFIENGKTRRVIFDQSRPIPKKALHGRSYTTRIAAKILGLPASVLKTCRDLGIYKTMHIGHRVSSFHEYDIEAFSKSILSSASPMTEAPDAEQLVMLSEVMARRLRSSERKASLIQAVIDKALSSYVRSDASLRDIALIKDEVDEFLERTRIYGREYITAHDAAKILCIDARCIPWLIDNGHLKSAPPGHPPGVKSDSVERFSNEYVTVTSMAKELGENPRTLLNQLKSMGEAVLYAERDSNGSLQPFISRQRANSIVSILRP